jgi:hypothetical protein
MNHEGDSLSLFARDVFLVLSRYETLRDEVPDLSWLLTHRGTTMQLRC